MFESISKKINLKSIQNDTFLKNILVLFSGTAIAQVAPLIFSPLLFRFYTPIQFGLFAFVTSISAVLSTFASARLPDLITIPEDNKKASNIFQFAWLTNISVSILSLFFVIIFFDFFCSLLEKKEFGIGLYFIPFLVFFQSSFPIFDSWFNRSKKYKIMSMGVMIRLWLLLGLSVVFGFFGLSNYGMIYAMIISLIILFIYQLYHFYHDAYKVNHFTITAINKSLSTLAEFKKSVFTLLITEAMASVIANILTIFFTKQYGLKSLGFYSQASKLIEAPPKGLSTTVGVVYKKEAIDSFNTKGYFDSIFLKTFYKLILFATPPFVLVYIFLDKIILILFGEIWLPSVSIGRIIIISSYFSFIFSPLDKGAVIRRKNLYYFLYQLFRVIMILLVIAAYFQFQFTMLTYLSILTAVNSLMLFIDFIFNYQFSKKTDNG